MRILEDLKILLRSAFFACALGLLNTSALAESLVAGWMYAPPLVTEGENGEPTGYFADLTRLIASEAGLEVKFREYADVASFTADYQSGEATFYAGMPAALQGLLQLEISDEVSPMRLALFALRGRIDEVDKNASRLPRVGHTNSMTVWRDSALDGAFEFRTFDTANEAPLAVLRGDVDFVFTSEQAFSQWSHAARLEHLFEKVPESTRAYPRVVGVHPSRMHLIPDINEAIARLKEKGAFLDLRRKHFMHLFDPVPEVLRVGVINAPPMQWVDQHGNANGFAVDVFRDLAEIAGIRTEFQAVARQELDNWSDEATVDLLPLLAMTEARRQRMDLTLPVYDAAVMLYSRNLDGARLNNMAEFGDGRIGTLDATVYYENAQSDWPQNVRQFLTPAALHQALEQEQIDGIVIDSYFLDNLRRNQNLFMDVSPVQTLYRSTASIALRFGLGDTRSKLNNVIPQYVLSDRFSERVDAFRGTQIFWTEERKRNFALAGVAVGVVMLVLLVVAVVSERGRRRAAAWALRTQDLSSRLEAVLDATQSGIIGFDRKGKVAIANRCARDMLKVGEMATPFEWPTTIEFLHLEDKKQLSGQAAPHRQVVEGRNLTGQVIRWKHAREDTERYVRLANASISAEASADVGSVLIVDDITEQEVQRRQIARADKLSAIGQLTGGVAHDFNNVLSVVVGNLELAQDDLKDEEILPYLESALEATRAGVDLTRSMLAFARNSNLPASEFDLNDVLLETEEWVSRTLPKTVNIEVSTHESPLIVRADRSAVDSALLNLVVNARDAMDGAGELRIASTDVLLEQPLHQNGMADVPPGHYAVLSVSDSGEGIPETKFDQIFQPFFTTKETGKGTGLGLAMVMTMMADVNGYVQLISKVGQGATFKLFFPLQSVVEAQTEVQPTTISDLKGQGQRILIVDDEAQIRSVTSEILTRAGYRCASVCDGEAAVELLSRDGDWDLILTDVDMPGPTQIDQLIAEVERFAPKSAVVLMSGLDDFVPIASARVRRSWYRLQKPVSTPALLSLMKEALGTSS